MGKREGKGGGEEERKKERERKEILFFFFFYTNKIVALRLRAIHSNCHEGNSPFFSLSLFSFPLFLLSLLYLFCIND